MARIYDSIADTIGGTPLVRLNRVTEGAVATVLAKWSSSTRVVGEGPHRRSDDRGREREGIMKPGHDVIVEPTSGNTGIALAFVCAARRAIGCILTMPETMCSSAASCSRRFGASWCSRRPRRA